MQSGNTIPQPFYSLSLVASVNICLKLGCVPLISLNSWMKVDVLVPCLLYSARVVIIGGVCNFHGMISER